jgi:hypothetical protein
LQYGPAGEGEYVESRGARPYDGYGEQLLDLSEAHHEESSEEAEGEVYRHMGLGTGDLPGGHPYYRPGDRIRHGPYDEYLPAGLQDLVGDVPGCRAAEDHAYSDESEHQAIGGFVPSQDVMEERSCSQSLIDHDAAVHEEEPYGEGPELHARPEGHLDLSALPMGIFVIVLALGTDSPNSRASISWMLGRFMFEGLSRVWSPEIISRPS